MHSFDDEIWDEFRWESHINQMEDQNKQLRALFENGGNSDKPRWAQLMDEYNSKIEALNAFIEEELLIEESYFPDDEDLDEEDEDIEDPLFGFEFDATEDDEEEDEDDFDELLSGGFDDELDDWDEEGEEWKSLTDDFVMSDYGSIEQLPVYLEARSFGADLLNTSESGLKFQESSAIRDFISQCLRIPAKIAAGYAFGFEKDVLGANIAYSKKALRAANLALQQWRGVYDQKLVNRSMFLEINARLFELRNDIGIYVQELREQFLRPGG